MKGTPSLLTNDLILPGAVEINTLYHSTSSVLELILTRPLLSRSYLKFKHTFRFPSAEGDKDFTSIVKAWDKSYWSNVLLSECPLDVLPVKILILIPSCPLGKLRSLLNHYK